MTDLIKQAEALEVRACDHESAAKNLTVSAERCRAEAAKLREQAREPRGGWVAVLGAKASCASGLAGGYLYTTEEAAHKAIAWSDGYVYRVREVRPVRITDEHIGGAVSIWNDTYTNPDGFRAVMEYTLSLAGVEVEK